MRPKLNLIMSWCYFSQIPLNIHMWQFRSNYFLSLRWFCSVAIGEQGNHVGSSFYNWKSKIGRLSTFGKKLQCRSKFFWEVKLVGRFFLKRVKKKECDYCHKVGRSCKGKLAWRIEWSEVWTMISCGISSFSTRIFSYCKYWWF
jgi:hypothetical protein